ncbi:MAG: tetrahydrofolate dehydrogenase/cyclohydrolase catalytic domain-containing protein [Sphaerochaeta sp.]
MKELWGKPVAEEIYHHLEQETARFIATTKKDPHLCAILVGDDIPSRTYVEMKQRACNRLGFSHNTLYLDEHIKEEELLMIIESLNYDLSVDGILVQLPLPKQLNTDRILEAIAPEKDVDGFHPVNVGKILLGNPDFISCTPYGILTMFDYYNIETSGKHVVVVGRSNIVGKPIAALLMQEGRDATVTVCHSKTTNLKEITTLADILIVAVGKPFFITPDYVKEGAIVIDVGINRVEDASRARGYRLVGDVDYDNVAAKTAAITPVPGGVGVMTVAMLMNNTLHAAKKGRE